MRLLTAIAALAALLMAVSCGGGSAATAPRACAGLRRPGVPLAFAPARAPTLERARCIGIQYAAVIGPQSWGTLPRTMRRASPALAAWQQRSLLYACNACGLAGFGLDWVRAHHPDWILHSVQGTEVYPQRHPNWVLLNFTDPAYQSAWAMHVRKSLAAGGWTGVNVIDAGNDPDWSDIPIDPSTGQAMTEAQRRQYLADALSLVRAVLKIQIYSVLASNGPPTILDFRQVNSTDAVTVGQGFARLAGADWTTVLHYYRQVDIWQSGTYVGDTGRLSGAQQLYGLASFLLVAIPRGSAYIAPARPDLPLYAIEPGTPPDTPATAVGPVWVRTYPNAVVAVNPSEVTGTVEMGSAGKVTMRPGSAAIETGGHLLTTG
jgi:hypothetical protein